MDVFESGLSDEEIVRRRAIERKACAGDKITIISMKRVPDMGWDSRPWIDAVFKCAG
jgi:hypothetical protein